MIYIYDIYMIYIYDIYNMYIYIYIYMAVVTASIQLAYMCVAVVTACRIVDA